MGRHQLHSAGRRPRAAHRRPTASGCRRTVPAALAATLVVMGSPGLAFADDGTGSTATTNDGSTGGAAMSGGATGGSADPGATDPDTGGSSGTRTSGAGTPAGVDQAGSALGTVLGTDRSPGAARTTPSKDPAGKGADRSGDAGGSDQDLAGSSRSGATSAPTQVVLMEKNGSGVSGTATIDERQVVGHASGLDPTSRYVSFFYGATSSATNNNPCILDGTNPLPANQTVGQWSVDEKGNGTLRAPNPLGGRYKLQAGTMSIRKVEHGFSKATALPVNPASYSLVACGEVQRIAALDPVTDLVPPLPKFPSIKPLS